MQPILLHDPDLIQIDLFCGAGGVTLGADDAVVDERKVCVTIAAVNHNWKAIKSHWTNHKDIVHYEEDIRSLSSQLEGLRILVNAYRRLYPNAKVVLHASLPCPHFSKAKGGGRKRSDMRTLGWALCKQYNPKTRKFYVGDSYIQILKPDYIHIENVEEFLTWGPLTPQGKVIKERKGEYFRAWCNFIKRLGYNMDWRKINAADLGGYTKRTRLFGCFTKDGLPMPWPEQSHSKKGDMFTKKWLPVRDVLDFSDEGRSIFPAPGGRKKLMSLKTYKRIYAGCVKFVPQHPDRGIFLLKYHGNNGSGAKVEAIENPVGTLTTKDRYAKVQPDFLINYQHSSQANSIDEPLPTLVTKDRYGKICPVWIDRQYGDGGGKLNSIDEPVGTIPTVPKANLVQCEQWIESFYTGDNTSRSLDDPCPPITTRPHEALVKATFIDQQYGRSKPISIDGPVGALTGNPKNCLVHAERFIIPEHYDNGPVSVDEPMQTITAGGKTHYLVNPMWSDTSRSTVSSVEDPCFTLIASMNKTPPYLVTTETGHFAIEVYPEDPEIVRQLKEFMAANGIVDIKIRMLRIPELKKIQGFPVEYFLYGNQEDQKLFIGDSVHPLVMQRWFEAKGRQLREYLKAA